MSEQIQQALLQIKNWARQTKRDERMVEILAAENDESERLSAPEPMSGSIPQWQLPPSYRAFLACCSGLSVSWDMDDDEYQCQIFTADEISENSDIVYMPDDVSFFDDDNFLSTNHLVPFAGGAGEFVWCFDVTQPDSRGEYPVYLHQQDEPAARYIASGEWIDGYDRKPDFASFGDWFAWVGEALSQGNFPDEYSLPRFQQ